MIAEAMKKVGNEGVITVEEAKSLETELDVVEGTVIAVGSGTTHKNGKTRPLDVKAGDKILFGKYSGTEVKIDGEDLLIMKESDVMGVIEGGSAAKKKAA